MDLSELERWFSDRPEWLRDACRRLGQLGQLSETDYEELLSLCKLEAVGGLVPSTSLPAGFLDPPGVPDRSLRLLSIGDLNGVNALSPSRPLEFGTEPLCIVYGRNGSGKSGYVRLLKHACGAKCLGELHPNVFSAEQTKMHAKLMYIDEEGRKEALWSGPPIPDLRGVDIYDTACGLVYVNDENEVTFEPWLLRLFTKLTSVCEEIRKRLQSEVAALSSSKPQMPEELRTTDAAAWYHGLSASVLSETLTSRTAFADEDESLLYRITLRLAEPDPQAKGKTLSRQQTTLEDLCSALEHQYDEISAQRCQDYFAAKEDSAAKRKAAEEDANAVFSGAPLEGVGTKTWRLLWEAARQYSTEHAYMDRLFPNVDADARCVLCQQVLDEGSRLRFSSFEKHVKGELQDAVRQAQQRLDDLSAAFMTKPEPDKVAVTLDAAGVNDETTRTKVIEFVKAISSRKQTALSAPSMNQITVLPCRESLDILRAIVANLRNAATESEEDAKGENRLQLENQSKELRARKWLHEQSEAVSSEILRLRATDALNNAIALTNTTALSKRKSSLADELITNAYVQRFQDGLRQLKAHNINVTIRKTRTQVGKVYHQVILENVQKEVRTSEILSEGEFRIVSLAAFLADTEGRGMRTPFVFDDPISSLDHVYEEETARRLCQLSRSRQVIVFTHRLSLVGLLQKYVEKEGIKSELVCLSQYRTGDLSEIPINFKRTDHAVNSLVDHRVPAARKALTQGDERYLDVATVLCHDVRVLLERIVEADLLNSVVQRFSQEVNTKNRIFSLAKITEAECKLIDDLLTKYSRFEHSQPDEAFVMPPMPDEIEQDLLQIQCLVTDLRRRNNP